MTWLSALMFAVGSVGYYRGPISLPPRMLVLAVGGLLIIPGVYADFIGLGAFTALVAWQPMSKKKPGIVM